MIGPGKPFPDQDVPDIAPADRKNSTGATVIAGLGSLRSGAAGASDRFEIERAGIDQFLQARHRMLGKIALAITAGAERFWRIKRDQPIGGVVNADRIAIDYLDGIAMDRGASEKVVPRVSALISGADHASTRRSPTRVASPQTRPRRFRDFLQHVTSQLLHIAAHVFIQAVQKGAVIATPHAPGQFGDRPPQRLKSDLQPASPCR